MNRYAIAWLYRAAVVVAFIAHMSVLLAHTAQAEWSVEEMNAQIDQTNFVVNRGCSGTLIDLAERYVLTAAHCVKAQYETIEVEEIDEEGVITKKEVRRRIPGFVKQIYFDGPLQVREVTYRTELVAVDLPYALNQRDLAVVRILSPIPNLMASRFACEEPARGETAYVVGNPKGSLYASVHVGIISSTQRTYGTIKFGKNEKRPLMQVAAGVIGGNSGGAVYDINGRIIGVPVLAARANEVLGFAVPLADIRDFLEDNGFESIFDYCDREAD